MKDILSRKSVIAFILLAVYGNDYGSELPRKIERFKADCKASGILVYNEGDFLEIC